MNLYNHEIIVCLLFLCLDFEICYIVSLRTIKSELKMDIM